MRKINYLFIIVYFVQIGCGNKSKIEQEPQVAAVDTPKATEPVVVIPPKPALKRDTVLNTYALYLAGMRNEKDTTVLSSLYKQDFYAEYREGMNKNFEKIETNRLAKMREWAKVELKPELENQLTLFYPFSGPDCLHAITFFPDAKEYIMIAMEGTGDIPDLKALSESNISNYLSSVSTSLEDVFNKSYFITKKMMVDLTKTNVNGVTPLIAIFLSRTNHEIVSIENQYLNKDGVLVSTPDSTIAEYNSIVKVTFTKAGTDSVQTITYIQANLGDYDFDGKPSLKKNEPLKKYLENLPPVYTYLKSASYLMSYTSFSEIRKVCLEKSKTILQDDTGIGFKYFDKDKWDFNFYGKYAKPVKDFPNMSTKELEKAYKENADKVKALTFSLGYHWGKAQEQNLMIARVKN